jgi:hypothetical protein
MTRSAAAQAYGSKCELGLGDRHGCSLKSSFLCTSTAWAGALTETETVREFLAFFGDLGKSSKSGCRYFAMQRVEL